MPIKTVSNTTPKAILDACRKSGIRANNLVSNAGISKASIAKKGGRITFQEVIKLWGLSYTKTQDRMIGIKAAKQLSFGAFKVIDYMMVKDK